MNDPLLQIFEVYSITFGRTRNIEKWVVISDDAKTIDSKQDDVTVGVQKKWIYGLLTGLEMLGKNAVWMNIFNVEKKCNT